MGMERQPENEERRETSRRKKWRRGSRRGTREKESKGKIGNKRCNKLEGEKEKRSVEARRRR